MPDTITPCVEEEYSLFPSYLWRRRSGWRPLLMYFRGPAGVPFFIVPFLTLIGLWRFARRPRRLADADMSAFRGATVTHTCTHLGSYGMGGPGFVGLRLRIPSGHSIWIAFTIWAAAGWLTIGDELAAEGYSPDEQRKLSGTHKFSPLAVLVGSSLTDIQLEHELAKFTFNGATGSLALRLRRDSSSLPVHRGSKQRKILAPSQDVRDAVIVSKKGSLWLGDV